MIELSTLTGAMLVALGHGSAGLYGNDTLLVDNIVQASHQRGEQIVPLPLGEESFRNNDTVTADVRNTGCTRFGGAANAAAFLHHFVEEGVKYAHIDIAGYGMDMKGQCATGLGAQSILQYLCNQ